EGFFFHYLSVLKSCKGTISLKKLCLIFVLSRKPPSPSAGKREGSFTGNADEQRVSEEDEGCGGLL
ncbi:hypothetical protein, partial [uncultured Bacteroides sp.]|uniref:hypothetical protein n=1 Tax=uncultured Bacteroides sp. TaxID=162156 RepID=UPI0025B03EBD